MENPSPEFRRRVQTDPRLRDIVNQLVTQLLDGEVTTHDITRCTLVAVERYAEQYATELQS